MRDLAFVAFLVALLGLGFRRPFLFVLAYAYIDTVSPQRLSYYLLNSLQLSLIVACLAFAGWLLFEKKDGLRFTVRQGLMLLAAWRLLSRADLDDDRVDPAADAPRTGWRAYWSRRGA